MLLMTDAGIDFAAATDIGPRKVNADAYLLDDEAGLLAVADGMGDTARSAAVARAALEAVRELFLAPWSSLPRVERSIGEAAERLWLGVIQANGRLHVPRRRAGTRLTWTTFVGAVMCPRHFCIMHVGDSRAYVMRSGTRHLVKLTTDDTVLGRALARGVPHEVAAEQHDAHALTRAIGLRPSLDVRPALYPWGPGDVLLLCSDGVTDWLCAREIADTLVELDDLDAVAHALVVRAVVAGGRDNATAVLARCTYGATDRV